MRRVRGDGGLKMLLAERGDEGGLEMKEYEVRDPAEDTLKRLDAAGGGRGVKGVVA